MQYPCKCCGYLFVVRNYSTNILTVIQTAALEVITKTISLPVHSDSWINYSKSKWAGGLNSTLSSIMVGFALIILGINSQNLIVAIGLNKLSSSINFQFLLGLNDLKKSNNLPRPALLFDMHF